MELINLFMNKKENKSINVSDVQVWMSTVIKIAEIHECIYRFTSLKYR